MPALLARPRAGQLRAGHSCRADDDDSVTKTYTRCLCWLLDNITYNTGTFWHQQAQALQAEAVKSVFKG